MLTKYTLIPPSILNVITGRMAIKLLFSTIMAFAITPAQSAVIFNINKTTGVFTASGSVSIVGSDTFPFQTVTDTSMLTIDAFGAGDFFVWDETDQGTIDDFATDIATFSSGLQIVSGAINWDIYNGLLLDTRMVMNDSLLVDKKTFSLKSDMDTTLPLISSSATNWSVSVNGSATLTTSSGSAISALNVGSHIASYNSDTFTINITETVPEPTSLTLLVFGIIPLVSRRRN